MVTRACTLALAVGLLGCDGATPVPRADAGDFLAPDAAAPDAASMDVLRLQLATGRPGQWVPFADGDVVRLQRGCQGSQHVFVSARAAGASSGPLVVSLSLVRERDGLVASAPFEVRMPFDRGAEPGWREETGLMPVVPRASNVIGETVLLDGFVVDASGARADARRTARVQWGPDDCG